MDLLDKVLLEWSARTDKGYPDLNNEQDLAIFESMFGFRLNEDSINDAGSFDRFLHTRYAVDGQKVLNTDNFFTNLNKSPNKDQLLSLVLNSGKKPLKSSHDTFSKLEEELFDIIMGTVKIPNGEPSELWFAIIYDGKIKGGVAGETGITADVVVGSQGVSLKNYNKLNVVDFGSLGSTVEQLLRDSINLFQILSGSSVTKTLTRSSINSTLDLISSPQTVSDIQEILELGESTKIATIKRLANQIESNLEDRDPRSIVQKFCNGIDVNIKNKLEEVRWWATIHDRVCYVESSSDLFEKLKCKEDRLSSYISSFKDLHLFVNGNKLFKEITS